MYNFLLSTHSLFRWLVVISLSTSIFIACIGLVKNRPFTRVANAFRHWTATIAHLQLVIGTLLYFQSPLVMANKWPVSNELINQQDFFRYFHAAMMFTAVIIITIGSAKAKREAADSDRYRTMLRWFCIALLLIIIAIPWPFSPLAARPLGRLY
ncbi:hypothetical protein DJ568_05570 [Mucilaginibacter hurinus]|uniref:Cytochrome B n=1 Tax=Mucilaginibacter hurinus TaxID=2201324 RepID=A0A367GRY0_9SPHI|nr:hypothetical protein [Mucilaginibacter hurinus]RCH56204.1 hypothetical protein DJ568_05570 [Mucilaginibacter hurinus]